MSNQTVIQEQKVLPENSTAAAVEAENGTAACPLHSKSWLKRRSGHGDLLCDTDPPFRRNRILRPIFGSDRKRGSKPCGPAGLSDRDVCHDAHDDERYKVEDDFQIPAQTLPR
jgi:hypothetical protein